MILLQLSAAQGPAECCLAIAKAAARLGLEAEQAGVVLAVIDSEPADIAGSLRSILISLDGDAAPGLAARWNGTLQWICASPYRRNHARKNWFIGGACFEPPPPALASQVRFEAIRSSGPGGQHVNTTASAVRATHQASGISVRVQSERSQHANKRVAILLLARRLEQLAQQRDDEQRGARRSAHHALQRGSPLRRFRGEQFEPMA